MPRRYPPEVRRQVLELARAGTRVKQLAKTFGTSEATIYNWLKQDKIDRGELEGLSTDQAIELAAAKRRIRQLETELAVARKVNEVFLEQGLPPKALPGDPVPGRAGNRCQPRLPPARRLAVGYYDWKTRPMSPRALRRIWLAGEIADVHKASSGTYGALRVTAELRHAREIVVGHNAVESIMRELGIKGLPDPAAPEGRPASRR